MNRSILRDMIAYLPARVGPALIALLSIPIFTRLLSADDYGHYLLALTTLTLIGSLCVSWLVSVIVRFHAGARRSVLAKTCSLLLAGSVIAGIVLWCIVAVAQGRPFDRCFYLLAGAFWIAIHACFEYLAAWMRAADRALGYSLAVCFRSAGTLVLALPFLILGIARGEAILVATALAALPAVLLMPRFAFASDVEEDERTEGEVETKALLAYGLPAALSNLAISGLSFADRFVIKANMGSAAVAVYGASYDIAERSIFFVNSMLLLSSSVMGVKIFVRDGEERAAEFLSKLLRIYLLGAAPLVTIMIVLAPQIIATLFPAAYRAGADILPIIAASGLLVGIMHRYSLVLSFHKRTATIMWCSAAALALNLGACSFLIPRFGLLGAALGTGVGYGCWLIFIRLAVVGHHAPRFPWLTGARVLISASLAAISMHVIADDGLVALVAVAIGGLAVYGIALVLLREITLDEVKAVLPARLTGSG